MQSVVTLSIQNNAKLFGQLKSDFKRTVNWNKHQLKSSIERQNLYVDFVIASSFQGANRLFVLSIEDNTVRKGHTRYFLPAVEIKDCNFMTDGKKSFLMSQ